MFRKAKSMIEGRNRTGTTSKNYPVTSGLIVSDSVTPWTEPTGLLCPWDFPGKNTRVGFHFLLQGIFLTQGLNLSPVSPALAGGFFITAPPGKPHRFGGVPPRRIWQSFHILWTPIYVQLS